MRGQHEESGMADTIHMLLKLSGNARSRPLVQVKWQGREALIGSIMAGPQTLDAENRSL